MKSHAIRVAQKTRYKFTYVIASGLALLAVTSASAQSIKPENAPLLPEAQASAPKKEATSQPQATANAQPVAEPSTQRLALATVAVPGENIEDGDYVTSSRYYGEWRLTCDELVSKERRNCKIEQETLRNGRWALGWKLVESAQKKPFFVIQFPRGASTTHGFQLVINGFIREFPVQEWACAPTLCEVYIPVDKTAQQLIFGASTIRFRYYLGNEWQEIPGTLKGFSKALDALTVPKEAEVAVASAIQTETPAKRAPAPKKKREAQFQSLQDSSDSVPPALRKIYGVD